MTDVETAGASFGTQPQASLISCGLFVKVGVDASTFKNSISLTGGETLNLGEIKKLWICFTIGSKLVLGPRGPHAYDVYLPARCSQEMALAM